MMSRSLRTKMAMRVPMGVFPASIEELAPHAGLILHLRVEARPAKGVDGAINYCTGV